MKRSTWPVPRKCSASATMPSSFAPRLTTAFTLTGSPAAAAASIPSSTLCTGKSTSFNARNASSSTESRLTVTRSRPASASACAFCGSSAPFVVSASSMPSIACSIAIEVLDVASHERLAAGDPDALHAAAARIRATTRAISSKLRSSFRSRNWWSRP